MLEMAGEVADGVIMLAGATSGTLEFALSHVRLGLERSGRAVGDIDVAWGAATVIDDQRETALEQTRLMAAWYANHSAQYARHRQSSKTKKLRNILLNFRKIARIPTPIDLN